MVLALYRDLVLALRYTLQWNLTCTVWIEWYNYSNMLMTLHFLRLSTLTGDWVQPHMKSWAVANKLHLNLSKTKEIVFRLPIIKYFSLTTCCWRNLATICGKLLGVITVMFQAKLNGFSFSVHALSVCTAHFCWNFCVLSDYPVNCYLLSLTPLLSHIFCMLYTSVGQIFVCWAYKPNIASLNAWSEAIWLYATRYHSIRIDRLLWLDLFCKLNNT